MISIRLKILSSCLLALLLAGKSHAETSKAWKASLYGRSTSDNFSTSKTVGISGLLRIKHDASSSIQLLFIGGALLETGSDSSLFTNEFAPRNRLLLQEASVRWKMFQPLFLKAGALEQDQNPLFLDGGTFPAAKIILAPDFQSWILTLESQGAIPTSDTLSTRATGKENTPLLFTQKAILGWQEEENKILLQGTYFQYKNLTRGIAQDSRFYGNTVTGIGTNSRFVYDYRGFSAGPEFGVRFHKNFSWLAGASFLQNEEGPRDNNQGLYAYTQLSYRGEAFSLHPKIEWYRNEADAAPGFYTSKEFGHNNREGEGAALLLELPKVGLNVEAKAKQGRLIEPRTFQRDRFHFFQLTVSIPYADF